MLPLWIGGFLAAGIRAAEVKVALVDDFSSAKATETWQARESTSKVTYEAGGLLLELPQYAGADGEARWPGMERSADDLELARYNGFLVDLTNPTDQTQSLVGDFKDGSSTASVLLPSVAPGRRCTLKIAFDQAITGAVDWTGVKRIVLYQSRPATPQKWLVHSVRLYCDDPAQTVLGRLQSLLLATQTAFKEADRAGIIPAEEKKQDQQMLGRWAKALQGPSGFRGRGITCHDELTALQSRLRLAALGRQFGSGQVLWSVVPGTRFEPAGALTQYEKPLDKLAFFAARGQYDDRIVRVTNLSSTTQDWRVRFEADGPNTTAALSVRRNQVVVAADRSVVGDVLAGLNAAGTVTVAPGETAELWVRVDARHHDWKAGVHAARMVLVDLRRGVSSQVKIPIEIKIHSFDLAAAAPMHLNVWFDTVPYLDGHVQAALDNLADYGCDVFVIHPWHLPWPKLKADGEVEVPLDMESFDRLVRMFRTCNPHAKILISLGLDSDVPELQQLKSHLAVYSPQWEKGMRYWLGQFMDRMRQLNVPTGDYAFYVSDEPGRDELDLTIAVARIARSINPAAQIYVNGINLYFDDPKQNDRLMGLTHIWQIGGDYIGVRPALLSTLKTDRNLDLWVYQCRTGTRARQLGADAYNYYRLLAWQAMRNGMNGIGYWVYCWNTAKDLWDGTTGDGSNLVYPDAGKGILMSVRWELVRMSLDDVKYHRLLQKAAEGSLPRELKMRIDALLGGRFEQVLDHPRDPGLAMQWRIDAGSALDQVARQH